MSMTSAELVSTQAVFPFIEADSSVAGIRRPARNGTVPVRRDVRCRKHWRGQVSHPVG